VRLVSFIVICLLPIGCSECDITNVRNYASPDAQHVATVYAYDCHDTTGLYWVADMRRMGRRLHHPGNVIKFGLGDMVPHVTVTWQSSTQLVVGYPFDAKHVPTATNIDGVTITFASAHGVRETQQ
jgi:hypothetical protein